MRPIRPESSDFHQWSEAWRRHRSRSALETNLVRAGINEEEFWQQYALWQSTLRNGYPGVLLNLVKSYAIQNGTVLDIGAGSGAFAIPLAAMSRWVTAIEPSPTQVAQLSAAIARAGVHNVGIVQSRWEDVDIHSIGNPDLVLAAHSFQMNDVAGALRKMCMAAKRSALFIHTAGHDLSTTFRELFEIEPGPDYTYLQHILSGLGYDISIDFVNYSYEVPLDAQLSILRCNPGLSETQCARLRVYLDKNGMTTVQDGSLWIRREYRDAFIVVNNNDA